MTKQQTENIQKDLQALTGVDQSFGGVFVRRELTPPVKVAIEYQVIGKTFKRDVTVRYMYPKCFEDTLGFQKPYWTIEAWEIVYPAAQAR